MKIFAVHDIKADVYDHFHLHKTVDSARRNYEMSLADEKSLLYAYKEDFNLVCIGEICEVSGQVLGHLPHIVCCGADYSKGGLKDE